MINKERKQKDKNEFKKVKNKKEKTPKQIKRNKKVKIFILILIIIFIIYIGISTAISLNTFKNIIKDMTVNKNSIVVDSDGNTIAEIGSERIQEKISSEEIPTNLKNAYVAIEDERYYKHGGVDAKRTASAIASYIFHRGSSSFGGSSITQQLVKNLTGDSSNKISRKVNEWEKAITVESFMSKDEILELYLNIIYVGPNIYGVEAGSQYYFNKSAKDLTLEECAFLAGINNSPNSYNPFNKENSEKINKRTKTVLAKMLELKYINQEDYKNAISKVDEGLKFKKGKVSADDAVYSYHTDALLSQTIKDISDKKHISKTFATNYINMAGLTIYSTQNSNIQGKMEKEFEKTKYQLKSQNGGEHSQAAMVLIDHKTGQVLGCVGGLGKKTTSRGLNRATQSIRQTGSCIKPIAVLVPGISEKLFTGATIFDDEQKEFADGYNPENYSKYLGNITVRRALESSQNIPFVEMMEEITPKTSMKYLKKMGITTLSEKDENLALALGGLDKGISPLQMASAYATIANDGVYIEPTFYTKIINSNSQIIIQTKQKKKKIFSKDVAYIVKELLTEPVKGSNGTATYCAISGMDVAAKTGTTDENYDRWLCGFTPYYTAVTWYGFDQNETINYNGKKNPAGILWANIMNSVHSNLASAKFTKTSGVTKVTVCGQTGKIANTGCPNTYEEYFLAGTKPEVCDKHSGKEINTNNSSQQNTYNTTNKKTDTVTNSFDTTTTDDLDLPTNTKKDEKKTNTITNNKNDEMPNNKIENNNSINSNSNNKQNSINNTTNSNDKQNLISTNKTNQNNSTSTSEEKKNTKQNVTQKNENN